MNYQEVIKELTKLSNATRAKSSARYFKTGAGQYGEGGIFIGITVPQQRKVAQKYVELPFSELQLLIKNPIHEYRFVALEILVFKYETGTQIIKKWVVDFYLKNTKYINNWDLVDTSAPYILGDYLFNINSDILFKLVKSKNIWERRIAIITTLGFIKRGRYTETLAIAKLLLNDQHDLIHKAVGWALREVGKVSLQDEINFLETHCLNMPRTTLRYAIERFPEKSRKEYLNRKKEK